VDRAGAAMATKIKQPIHWRRKLENVPKKTSGFTCSLQFGDLLFNIDH